jgi:hypothetical protein
MKLPWQKSENPSHDEWSGYEGGIRILRALPREDTVLCLKPLITRTGWVDTGDRCHKDHPVVTAFPKHFAPMTDAAA